MQLPMFISFTETKGDDTSYLVDKVRAMILEQDLEDNVTLVQIKTKSENRTQNQIEYSIEVNTNDVPTNQRIFDFLTKVNESLYDTFPCFIEPPLGVVALPQP